MKPESITDRRVWQLSCEAADFAEEEVEIDSYAGCKAAAGYAIRAVPKEAGIRVEETT